ncbi:MAG: hypothetical protein QXF58_00455 [Desulfurococcaceae archaeon]
MKCVKQCTLYFTKSLNTSNKLSHLAWKELKDEKSGVNLCVLGNSEVIEALSKV